MLKQRYSPIEYPKWIGDVLVQNAAEERALRAVPVDAQLAPVGADRIAATEAPVATNAAPSGRSPSSAAVRMRRTRDRRREGKRTVRFDISAAQIDALAAAGFLDPAKLNDSTEVALGVGRLMERATRSVT